MTGRRERPAPGAAEPRIAIASTGLGHVTRGVEAWAADLAGALDRRGAPVTLFRGSGPAAHPYERVIPCVRRGTAASRLITRAAPRWSWRVGLTSDYALEQVSFAPGLASALGRRFDIVHTQDPQLAEWLERARRLGVHGAQVILAHGTEEADALLARLSNIQQLAPAHVEAARARGVDVSGWFAIPNFVDRTQFRPAAGAAERGAARHALGVAEDAFVVLAASALKRAHKRVDALFRELDAFRRAARARGRRAVLVAAGATDAGSGDLVAEGTARLGEDLVVLRDLPRERMPELHRAADAFFHGALVEMMPIALVEALATGTPIVAHAGSPVIAWIAGEGGELADLGVEGQAAEALARLLDGDRRAARSAAALARAEAFSEAAVVERIRDMYREVLARGRPAWRA